MQSDFEAKLNALIEASEGRITIVSGDRDEATQRRLWEDAVARYGPDEARNWVAPPGNSFHEKGMAADLSFADSATRQWAHDNAARFGLWFPLSNEEWHVEPLGSRSSPVDGGAPRSSEEEVVMASVLGSRQSDPFAGILSMLGVAPERMGAGESVTDLVPALRWFSTGVTEPGGSQTGQGGSGAPTETSGDFEAWLTEIARIAGLDEDEKNALRTIAQYESSFQNIGQQITDINSGGNEAFGPFQVTPETFNRHMWEGYSDHQNPVHSGLAAVQYVRRGGGGGSLREIAERFERQGHGGY